MSKDVASEEVQHKTDIKLRSATLDDVNALILLENKCFQTDRLSRRSFRYFIRRTGTLLLLAETNNAILGYVLTIFRHGTSIARVYSIAVDPSVRQSGIGRLLLEAAEDNAREKDCIGLRLEVHPDNSSAINLYKALGYRQFGRYLDYYDDHSEALRLQKNLVASQPSENAPPYYAQTSEFSCGPAAMMMAMRALDPEALFDRTLEFRLWRESTTVFMQAGHGGCEPIGMAVALARRGFRVEVSVNRLAPYFVDSVRDRSRRDAIQLIQQDYANEAEALGVVTRLEAFTFEGITNALKLGAKVLVLISQYQMVNSRTPHWVMVYGFSGNRLLIHDPWIEPDDLETFVSAAALPVPWPAFDRMARWGRARLRAAIFVTKELS